MPPLPRAEGGCQRKALKSRLTRVTGNIPEVHPTPIDSKTLPILTWISAATSNILILMKDVGLAFFFFFFYPVASSWAAARSVCRNVELDKYTHIKQTQTFTVDAHMLARPTVRRAQTPGALSCFRKRLGEVGEGSCDSQHTAYRHFQSGASCEHV